MPDHADKEQQASRRTAQLDMFTGEIISTGIDAAALRAGHDSSRAVFCGKFMQCNQRLAIHVKSGIDADRKLALVMQVPVGIVDMRLLPRGTGEKPVCRKRPEDELAPEDRAKNLHHQRMLHHIDENLPFVEQVPDTPLQVDLVGMAAMEMCCRLHTIGMMIDDPVCCGDLLRAEDTFDKIISGAVNERIYGLIRHLIPMLMIKVLACFGHDNIHSWLGSFLNFQIRFGPAMTLR